MYKYPQKLIDYLTECESEGYEIHTTWGMDSVMWIIDPTDLENWYIIIEWCEGSDDFSLVNLTGKAYKMMERFINERI